MKSEEEDGKNWHGKQLMAFTAQWWNDQLLVQQLLIRIRKIEYMP